MPRRDRKGDDGVFSHSGDRESLEVLPLRVRITSILRKALLSGEFRPGQELSLTEVAEWLGVSRTPVREAFQTLAEEDLLELRMNRGAVVTGVDEAFIRDHFRCRIILEREAVLMTMENRGDLSELLAVQAEAERCPGMDEAAYRVYNQKIHTGIWLRSGSRKLYKLLSSLWNGPSGRAGSRDTEHEAASIREHRQLLACMEQGDREGAGRAITAHLERSMENILENFRNMNPEAGPAEEQKRKEAE